MRDTTLGLAAVGMLLLVTLACSPTLAPSPTPPPSPSPTLPPTLPPEALDTGWQAVGHGLEVRRLWVEQDTWRDRLWLARADPAQARFRVLYDSSLTRTVRAWFDAVQPRLVVNAGYFTPERAATALVVSDGLPSGQSYVGFGGMFAVSAGRVELRSLSIHPYTPGEPLDQAVQAFPMLVLPGGRPAVTRDDGQLARRTAVGQDRAGRIVFVVSAAPIFSLQSLAAFLARSDLDLDVALNLDGGTSSGLWYRDQAGQASGVDSWVYVPAVIVVE